MHPVDPEPEEEGVEDDDAEAGNVDGEDVDVVLGHQVRQQLLPLLVFRKLSPEAFPENEFGEPEADVQNDGQAVDDDEVERCFWRTGVQILDQDLTGAEVQAHLLLSG